MSKATLKRFTERVLWKAGVRLCGWPSDGAPSALAAGPERWGKWSDATLRRFTDAVRDVRGDFVEIGVARGATFHRLVTLAREQGKRAHAFDSFQGMGKPGKHDRKADERGAHLPGDYGVGGKEGFRKLMDAKQAPRESYDLWEGWIPEVFEAYPQTEPFSLAIVDVDHYQPTRDAIRWVWPRVRVGGFMLLDDFAPEWLRESTVAIHEFLREDNRFQFVDQYNNHLMLKRVDA